MTLAPFHTHWLLFTPALGLLTAEGTLSPDASSFDKNASAVVDFFNPVADVRDVLGLAIGEPEN